MRILILGGYGTFGGNLARLLARHERLTLLIAGRSVEKARALCKSLSGNAKNEAVFFDRDQNVETQIAQIKPDLVVDAMGPYQVYGDDPYRVVKACLTLSTHYMDLADGSDFVKGISQFDSQAKEKNIFILSGVSTCPVLTSAVTRRLSRNMTKVSRIKAGIAPSPYAGVGLNVVRAITAYAGKPISLLHDGKRTTAHALTESMRYTIAPPGHTPLDHILFSLVDVPDLQLLPDTQPGLDSIWFGAGPVPEILHRMLIALSWLVRFRMLPTLLPFAKLFHFVLNTARWGEHRGGMFVSVEGTDGSGKSVERSWHLVAERGDGPFIPSMAVAAIMKRVLSDELPASGARPAINELELVDYEPLFREKAIYIGERASDVDMKDAPLYERTLGPAFEGLPIPLREMHNLTSGMKIAEGTARVETGRNIFARLMHAILGFPKAGENVPVRVTFQLKNGGELWQRDFAGRQFSSFQIAGRKDRLIHESFGPVKVGLAPVRDGEKLRLITRRCWVFGIPIPLFLAPGGDTYEYVKNGTFHFHVEIKQFPFGLIVKYQGQLAPKQEQR